MHDDPAAEARRAANRAGMSLSEWLDAVLHESDEDTARPAGRRAARHHLDDHDAAIGDESRPDASASAEHRLDRLDDAIGTDWKPPHDTAPQSLRGIARRLDRLSASVPEGNERSSTRETIRELEGRLQDIARRVESRQRPPVSQPDSDAAATTPVSRTRPPLERPSLDRPPLEPARHQRDVSPAPINGLKEAIAGIASRQKTLEVEFDRAVSGYADRVDHRIDIVSERLERTIDEALPTGQIREIREELRNLAGNPGARAAESKVLNELRLVVEEMARRIETVPEQVAADLAERLEDTVRRLDTATRSELDAIRAELREIAQDIDRTTRGEFDALRGEIGLLATRIETMPAPDSLNIETKLEEIATRLSAAAREEFGAMAREEFGAIRADIRELAEQIDNNSGRGDFETLRQELRDFASQIDGAGRGEIDALRKELRDLGERLLAERTAIAATQGLDDTGLAELDAIRSDIRSLAEQIDGVRRDDYAALRRDMQAIGERVTQAPSLQTGELEKQLVLLGDRLAGAANDGDPEALAQIEQQISRLAETVDASSRQAVDTGNIEKSINDLFSRIEASRSDTMTAARDAAKEAIEQALSKLDTGSSSAEIVGVLREELSRQRGDAEANGQKTEEALQVVHATLMKVVDRLEDLEDDVDIAGRPGPDIRTEPRLDLGDLDLGDTDIQDDPVHGEPDAASETTTPKSAPIEDDTPLVPGTGRPKTAPSPRVGTDTASEPGLSSPSDFVAAARRAAQAAAAEQRGDKLPAESKKSALGGLRGGLNKYRRPLAIAAAMLILVYGAMKVASLLKTDPENASSLDRPAITSSLEETAPAVSAPIVSAARTVQPNTTAAPPAIPKDTAQVAKAENKKASGNKAKKTTAQKSTAKAPSDTTGSIPNPADTVVDTTPTPAPDSAPAGSPSPQLPSAQQNGSILNDLPASATPEKLRQAAVAGDPAAEFEVAVRFMDGRGLPHDAARAAEWYQKAAAQGLAPAQYRLGSLYEKGEGVERDLSLARMWYQRAAEQGNRKAMHNLAVLYADGIDGKPDYEKAATWFNQAAEYGLADSQFNLAVLFARGLGVQTDFAKSFHWFAVAADQGDSEALLKRDEIAQQLDQETLMKARATLDAWQPKPTAASANVVPEPQGGWGEVKSAKQAFVDRDMIMTTQSTLTKLGYTPGPADGEIGPRTRDAVRAFQRSVGMPDTGDITPELISTLIQTSS